MKADALELARGRIRVSAKALVDLEVANTYNEFFDAWFVFLTAWKGIYTVLEQGAKRSPQSMQWYGKKAAERKGDTLLQYLFQARNDEEHGLKRSVEHTGGSHLYRVTPGQVVSMQTDPITGKMRGVEHVTGQPLELLSVQPAGPTLVTVRGRDKREYAPPIIHLGNVLDDTSPIAVGKIALTYMQCVVDEAENFGNFAVKES